MIERQITLDAQSIENTQVVALSFLQSFFGVFSKKFYEADVEECQRQYEKVVKQYGDNPDHIQRSDIECFLFRLDVAKYRLEFCEFDYTKIVSMKAKIIKEQEDRMVVHPEGAD